MVKITIESLLNKESDPSGPRPSSPSPSHLETGGHLAKPDLPQVDTVSHGGDPCRAEPQDYGSQEVHPDEAPNRTCLRPDDREAVLNADPLVLNFGKEYVLCSLCGKELKLAAGRSWYMSNWLRHRDLCSLKYAEWVVNDHPGNFPYRTKPQNIRFREERPWAPKRVMLSADDRKKFLRADPYVLSFKEKYVDCSLCGKSIKLAPGKPWYMSNWSRHKAICKLKNPGRMKTSVQ